MVNFVEVQISSYIWLQNGSIASLARRSTMIVALLSRSILSMQDNIVETVRPDNPRSGRAYRSFFAASPVSDGDRLLRRARAAPRDRKAAVGDDPSTIIRRHGSDHDEIEEQELDHRIHKEAEVEIADPHTGSLLLESRSG